MLRKLKSEKNITLKYQRKDTKYFVAGEFQLQLHYLLTIHNPGIIISSNICSRSVTRFLSPWEKQ